MYLRNLDAERDWGFAGDYVEAMWLMLQHDTPDDFVIATGRRASVREFLEAEFSAVGLVWQDHVIVDERYIRPADVEVLQGNASKAHRLLGWRPQTSFKDLVQMMIEADLNLAKEERTLVDAGIRAIEWRKGRP